MTELQRGTTWRVLDHGWVSYVDSMGDDGRVEFGARQSTIGRLPKNKLAKFVTGLMRDQHLGPFEHPAISLQVRLPVVYMMQWHRHRTQSYSVQSRRYTTLHDDVYVPPVEWAEQDELRDELATIGNDAFAHYQHLLDSGVSREDAGLHLPLHHYRTMLATANLRNWLQFLALRLQPDAERPIREYARVIYHVLDRLYPVTVAAWRRHVLGRVNITYHDMTDTRVEGSGRTLMELLTSERARIGNLYDWIDAAAMEEMTA